MATLVGLRIENYRIVEAVGEGGMGAVYRAFDVMLERDVALKFLRPELVSDPEVAERFRQEAVVLARFHHPNIASVFGLHRYHDQLFMALEYVTGNTLEKVLAAGPLLPAQTVAVTSMVLEALEYAHRRGIVHRDIKAANLMVTLDGVVKVMDFGIARVLGGDRRTRAGLVVGTLSYMSPEQIQGVDVDARSDIYSTGIAVYEMLTGRPPFAADTEWALMQAQVKNPPPPFAAGLAIPPALEAVVMRALAKSPQDRFESASAFRAALSAAAPVDAAAGGGSEQTGGLAVPTPFARPEDVTAIHASAKSDPVRVAMAGLELQPTVPLPTPVPETARGGQSGPHEQTRLAGIGDEVVPALPPGSPGTGAVAPATSRADVGLAAAPAELPPLPQPAVPSTTPSRVAPQDPVARRRRAVAALGLVAGVVLLASAVAGWFLLRTSPAVDAPPQSETAAAAVTEDGAGGPPPGATSTAPAVPAAPPTNDPAPAETTPPARATTERRPTPRVAAAKPQPAPPEEPLAPATPARSSPVVPSVASPRTPAATLPPARFGGVRLVEGEGERTKERAAILLLEPGRLALLGADGREMRAVNYTVITRAAYSQARATRVLVVRSTRHFLKIDAGASSMLLRLDADSRGKLFDAFTARSGVAVAGRETDAADGVK